MTYSAQCPQLVPRATTLCASSPTIPTHLCRSKRADPLAALIDKADREMRALGRDASQQIVPGLGERGDPFSEQLGGHGVRVNTSLGEFREYLAGILRVRASPNSSWAARAFKVDSGIVLTVKGKASAST
jgi:hypothetical protein